MDKPTISVAMCTYNGERFLVEQLNSLLTQTCLPTEVIICDDGSTDRTLELLEHFQKNVLFDVTIYKNKTSMGTTKNFEKAMLKCKGDYIFLCDQDDFWLPNKIEALTHFLNGNPATELVFSNAELVDATLQKTGRTQWDVVRFGAAQKQQWNNGKATDIMLGGNRVTGCTVALRSGLVEVSVPFPTDIPEVIHDTWLAWVATVRQSIRFFDESLTLYRQHDAQQVGSAPRPNPPKVGFTERFSRPRMEKLSPIIKQRENLQKLYFRLAGIEKNKTRNLLKRKITFLTVRSQLDKNRILRVFPAFWQLLNGNYHRFKDQEANEKAPWLAFLGDLIE